MVRWGRNGKVGEQSLKAQPRGKGLLRVTFQDKVKKRNESEWFQDAQSIRTYFRDDPGTLSQTSMLVASSDCFWRLVTWEDRALCGHCCQPAPTQSLTPSRCFMNIRWKKESCLGLFVVLFPYKMALWSLTKAWAKTMAVGMKEGDGCESNLDSKIKQTGFRWWVSQGRWKRGRCTSIS